MPKRKDLDDAVHFLDPVFDPPPYTQNDVTQRHVDGVKSRLLHSKRVALIGPHGSGKTLLLQSVARALGGTKDPEAYRLEKMLETATQEWNDKKATIQAQIDNVIRSLGPSAAPPPMGPVPKRLPDPVSSSDSRPQRSAAAAAAQRISAYVGGTEEDEISEKYNKWLNLCDVDSTKKDSSFDDVFRNATNALDNELGKRVGRPSLKALNDFGELTKKTWSLQDDVKAAQERAKATRPPDAPIGKYTVWTLNMYAFTVDKAKWVEFDNSAKPEEDEGTTVYLVESLSSWAADDREMAIKPWLDAHPNVLVLATLTPKEHEQCLLEYPGLLNMFDPYTLSPYDMFDTKIILQSRYPKGVQWLLDNGKLDEMLDIIFGHLPGMEPQRSFHAFGYVFRAANQTRESGKKTFDPIEKLYVYISETVGHLVNNTHAITAKRIKLLRAVVNAEMIGQKTVLEKVVGMVATFLMDPNPQKPLNMMFAGTTGTGKTQTARFIADTIFPTLSRYDTEYVMGFFDHFIQLYTAKSERVPMGSGKRGPKRSTRDENHEGMGTPPSSMAPSPAPTPSGIRPDSVTNAQYGTRLPTSSAITVIDMGGFTSRETVTRLLGSDPGYVGSDRLGVLTDFAANHSSGVIVFDEIEKAHSDVRKALLGPMDSGQLVDQNKRVYNVSRSIFILTTNAGVKQLIKDDGICHQYTGSFHIKDELSGTDPDDGTYFSGDDKDIAESSLRNHKTPNNKSLFNVSKDAKGTVTLAEYYKRYADTWGQTKTVYKDRYAYYLSKRMGEILRDTFDPEFIARLQPPLYFWSCYSDEEIRKLIDKEFVKMETYLKQKQITLTWQKDAQGSFTNMAVNDFKKHMVTGGVRWLQNAMLEFRRQLLKYADDTVGIEWVGSTPVGVDICGKSSSEPPTLATVQMPCDEAKRQDVTDSTETSDSSVPLADFEHDNDTTPIGNSSPQSDGGRKGRQRVRS